jgi:hypothetical protein
VLWFRREYLGGSDERERQAGPNGRIPQTLEHT